MKQVAVIGAGRWGKRILKTLTSIAFSDHITIAHIGYGGSSETEAFLDLNYPQIPHTTNIEDILSDPQVEALIIATPIPTHREMVERALRARKHVCVEKPLAPTKQDVALLYDIANSKELVLMTNYLYLHDPDFYHRIVMPTLTATNVRVASTWQKYGTFESSLIDNLLVHELAMLEVMLEHITLKDIVHREPDRISIAVIGSRGIGTSTIDRRSTQPLQHIHTRFYGTRLA
jgi:hypothetical protein